MQNKEILEFLISAFEVELKNPTLLLTEEINVKLENGNLATIKVTKESEAK